MIKLLAVLLLSFAAASSQAAPHGILWARGARPASLGAKDAGAGNLVYYGGPVIEHAQVYAVFWGESVSAETKAKIGPFFASMLDSVYMDWLKEYATNLNAVDGRPGTNQTIGRGSFAGAVTIHPANTAKALKDADVQHELEAQIAAGHLAPADDSHLYMVYFPAGVSIEIEGERSCSSFCAYHEGFKTGDGRSIFYGIMPVCGGFGCGSGFDSLTEVSSHEAVEAITDPFPTPGSHPAYPQAWNTTGGEEISDLCASYSAKLTAGGVTSTVTGQWRNSTRACYNGPWAAAAEADVVTAPTRRANTALLAALSARELTCWDGR